MFLECGNCGQRLTTSHAPPEAKGVQCPHCGTTVPIFDQHTLVSRGVPPSELVAPAPPLQIEGYEILGCLGEGGMGIVYLARQVSLDRKVAIKVMSPALLKDPSFVARFDREIAALVRLSHPRIVTIFDRGQSPAGHVYYIMEYVEGRDGGAPIDLERLIADRCLNSQQVRALMLQVVQALGFAHREGIIHRDVKPSNILIDRHGFAKVADFGIASMRAGSVTRHVTVANQSVGTAIYMSPEQQRDAASVDHRSDIYSTGVMLYQMLTGELPMAGYEPPSKVVPGLSPQWDAIVAKALQQRPENRFSDMRAFEAALKSIGHISAGQPMAVPSPRTAAPLVIARGTSAGSPTTASQQSAVANRADVIKRAEQFFVQGQWKKAAELMAKAAAFFAGDEEIAALMVQYREKANQVDEVLARMAALAQQNRWCEVSQIIAELQHSGVSIKGIEQYAAAAQQNFGALQPLVATARSLLQQGRAAEAVAHANHALQYVADHADALEIVAAANKRLTRRRRSRRLVVGFLALACLAAIAGGVYLYFAESVVIDKARHQIANREYEDASQTLSELPHRWFVEGKAKYLQAIVDLKKYASAKVIDDSVPQLETSAQRLRDLFSASEGWLEQAKRDLADAVAQVPSDAEDSLPRALKIARKLNELKTIEPAALAKALLKKVESQSEFQSPTADMIPADYVKQILEWDATKARMVVGLVLPKNGSPQQGLQTIHSWAERTPSLGSTLGPAVLQVAEPYVTTGRYEKAKPFVDTAKQIDTHFDTWDYWEKQLQKIDDKNWQAAIQVLTFMVEGERNAARLSRATDLYVNLTGRHAGVEIKPPPEILDEIRRRQDAREANQFRQLIVEAEQLAKSRQYQDARARLNEARRLSSNLSSSDTRARELNEEVDFHLHLEKAQKCYASGDFAAALTEVEAAIQIRAEDKEALDCRNKIHVAVDKVDVEQHRQKAASAVAEGNYPDAVDEIRKAHAILAKPSNAEWSTFSRAAVDELAKTLIGKLYEQAKELSARRQYPDAKKKVRLGLRLSTRDEQLSQLLKEIEKLEVDPKTANISGMWLSSRDVIFQLIDNGSNTIGCKVINLPKEIDSCTGDWTRKEDKLEGKFRVVFSALPRQITEGTVGATIRDTNTLVVYWQEISWTDKPQNGTWKWRGKGEGTWKKQVNGAESSETPEDVGEPRVSPPGKNPAPPPPPAPLESQPSPSPRHRSPVAANLAAEPLPNGVVIGDLSIAIVRPITRNGDAAEITLGFRRVGSRWEGHDYTKLTVHDDRSNEYTSSSFGLDGGNQNLKGRPPAVKQMPLGFTWVSRIDMQLPVIAIEHIVKIEISEGLFGSKKQLLAFQNPALPSLEFKVPPDFLLSPGAKVSLDKNLVAEIGELAVGSSSSASLLLPISITNEDYNAHPCKWFKLYVQSNNGEVWEYSTIGKSGWNSEEIPGKTTRKLSATLADSGSRGSLSEGLHAVLLYRSPEGIFSELRFCGFVPVPDNVRQRMKKTTNK
jgi:serine/threonine protein kinase